MWRDIEDRHSDIMKLESSLKELHDMFQDISMLVADQVYGHLASINFADFIFLVIVVIAIYAEITVIYHVKCSKR